MTLFVIGRLEGGCAVRTDRVRVDGGTDEEASQRDR